RRNTSGNKTKGRASPVPDLLFSTALAAFLVAFLLASRLLRWAPGFLCNFLRSFFSGRFFLCCFLFRLFLCGLRGLFCRFTSRFLFRLSSTAATRTSRAGPSAGDSVGHR